MEGLGTSLGESFSDDTDENIVFTKDDAFELIEPKMKYGRIISNAQKNQMEPIFLTMEEGGRYKEEIAHDGQEFGYVLEGEAFYYNSEKNHYLSNNVQEEVKILWVFTPPSF